MLTGSPWTSAIDLEADRAVALAPGDRGAEARLPRRVDADGHRRAHRLLEAALGPQPCRLVDEPRAHGHDPAAEVLGLEFGSRQARGRSRRGCPCWMVTPRAGFASRPAARVVDRVDRVGAPLEVGERRDRPRRARGGR